MHMYLLSVSLIPAFVVKNYSGVYESGLRRCSLCLFNLLIRKSSVTFGEYMYILNFCGYLGKEHYPLLRRNLF